MPEDVGGFGRPTAEIQPEAETEDRMHDAGRRPHAAAQKPSHNADNQNRIGRWFEPVRQFFIRLQGSDDTAPAQRQQSELGQRARSGEVVQEPIGSTGTMSEKPPASIVTSLTNPDEVEEVDLLIEAPFYVPRGMVSMLYGPGGTSKSSLAAALGVHLALGQPFLGGRVQRSRVYYAEFEGAGQVFASAFRRIQAAFEQGCPGAARQIKKGFHQKHFTPEEKHALGGFQGILDALAVYTSGSYDVYVFDSFQALTLIDSNDGQLVAEVMFALRRFAQKTNAAVLVIDHTPKGNQQTAYGSAKKRDFSTHAVNITNDGDGRIRLRSDKCNVGRMHEFPVLERVHQEDTLRFRTSGFCVRIGAEPTTGKPLPGRLTALIHAARNAGVSTRTAQYEWIAQQLALSGEYPGAKPDTVGRWIAQYGLKALLPPEARGRPAA